MGRWSTRVTDVSCAIPKVVFSRTRDSVQGNVQLAEASVAEEAAAALDATDKDVSSAAPALAAAAVELGLVDELRMFRNPVVIGGGTPFLPAVTEDVALDLIETRTVGSRVIFECYRRVRDDSVAHLVWSGRPLRAHTSSSFARLLLPPQVAGPAECPRGVRWPARSWECANQSLAARRWSQRNV